MTHRLKTVLMIGLLFTLTACGSAVEEEGRALGEKRCACDLLALQNDMQAHTICQEELQALADETLTKYRDKMREDEAFRNRWMTAQEDGYKAACADKAAEKAKQAPTEKAPVQDAPEDQNDDQDTDMTDRPQE